MTSMSASRKQASTNFWDLGAADINRRDTGRARAPTESSRAPAMGPLSLTRVLRILQLLGSRPEGASLAEIGTFLAAPRSSTFALLQPLTATGYLARWEGRYRLASGAFELATDILGARQQVDVLDSVMNQLSDQTSFTIMHSEFLRDRGAAVHRHVLQSRRTIRYVGSVGVERPLLPTASGRAMLAFAGGGWTSHYLDHLDIQPTLRAGSRARRNVEKLLEGVRRDGYAASIGEFDPRIGAVAAPVVDTQGNAIGAIGVAGLASEIKLELGEVAPLVREAARALSAAAQSLVTRPQASRHRP